MRVLCNCAYITKRTLCTAPTSAAGALCALALGQYTQDTQTALLCSRWPTAKAGATYTALLAVFVLVPGLLTIWVSLLLLKLRGTAKGSHSSYSQHSHGIKGEATTAAAAREAVSAGSDPQAALRAVSAAAVGAVTSGSTGRLVAAAGGSLQLQLPVMPKQQAMPAGLIGSSSAQEAPRLDAAQQAASGAAGGVCLEPVECGRPQLEHLTKAWLATQQQQLAMHCQHSRRGSGSHRKHCFTVYAMGPERLVHQVQQLCNGVGGLCFVRKTHQL